MLISLIFQVLIFYADKVMVMSKFPKFVVFNFAILLKLRKFDARENILFYSITCLFAYVTSILTFFLMYFLTCLLLPYLSTSLRIGLFRFQAGGHKR